MSSILTNNSAMVALQTLQQINKNLGSTQAEISTGKSIASAKDNSAVWAISKQMESDVNGFKAIQESLALGQSTVAAVARNAAETVTDLLTEIKGKIVASQEENVDRTKIQTDIAALRDQINSVVGAAQFNGLNMVNGSDDAAVDILSSLDRAADGTVTSSSISVGRQDLSTSAAVVDASGTYAGGAAQTLNATQSRNFTVAAPTAGVAYSIGLTGTDGDASLFTPADYTTAASATGAAEIAYVAREGDTASDVAAGLAAAYASYVSENDLDTDILDISASGTTLTATSTVTDGTDTIAVRIDSVTGDNEAAGSLNALASIDVSTNEGARKRAGCGRDADPDRHRFVGGPGFGRRPDRHPVGVHLEPDRLADLRHRLAGGCQHGGGFGPPPGAAGTAAAGHPVAVDRQSGAAVDPGALPLIQDPGPRSARIAAPTR